jgi:hypothetical protein
MNVAMAVEVGDFHTRGFESSELGLALHGHVLRVNGSSQGAEDQIGH